MSGEILIGMASPLQVNFYSVSYWIRWLVPWIVVVAIFGLTALRAFNLRKAVTVRLRRRQALGIGLLALAMAWVSANFVFPHPQSMGNAIGDSYFVFQFFLPFLVFFYWIDASVLASRRSDPLFRDTFHWSSVRKAIWTFLVAMMAVYIIGQVIFYDLILHNSATLPNVVGGSAVLTVISLPFVAGPALLPMVARRSRDDAVKRHLRWFAYFSALLGLGVPGIFLSPLGQGLWAVSGYCLYRSVRALVTVSRLPSGDDIASASAFGQSS